MTHRRLGTAAETFEARELHREILLVDRDVTAVLTR
jgi:hypothetical protein